MKNATEKTKLDFEMANLTDQCFPYVSLSKIQVPCKVNFIDFKAAYDSIQRDSLWKTVEMYGLPRKLNNIMKNAYDGSKFCVKVDGEMTDWREVTTGVRQDRVVFGPSYYLVSPSIRSLRTFWVRTT